MDDASGEIFSPDLAGPPFHQHVPKAIEGEMGPGVILPLMTGIDKLLLGGAQVFHIETVILKDFPVLQADSRPRGSRNPKLHPAHHVLSHVEHRLPGGGMDHLNGLQTFMDQDGRIQTGLQLIVA